MKNGKILVVDDNDDHRNAIEFLLRKESYCDILTAPDGMTGLEILNKHGDIKLLLTDLAMLEISGVDLLEKIKNRQGPFRRIVITALDEVLPFKKAEELKVFAYLNKPISKHTLIFTVQSAFNDMYLEEAKKWEELGQGAIGFVKRLGQRVEVIPEHIHFIKREFEYNPESVNEKLNEIENIVEEIIGLRRDLSTPFEETTMEDVNIKEIIELSIDLIPIPDGIETIKNYGSEEYVVYSNQNNLQKVFGDVIGNAIDAMQDVGTKVLTISISRGSEETAQITIHDTGCGIPEEEKGKIFRPFHTTKGWGNFGLGLFGAKGTITKFGGTITFQSNREDGTSFVITLPLSMEEN